VLLQTPAASQFAVSAFAPYVRHSVDSGQPRLQATSLEVTVHSPTLPGASQRVQTASHEVRQQTPSTHDPEAHSLLVEHR
jgi:hypothetical protein